MMSMSLTAHTFSLSDVLSDIYNQLAEQGEVPMDDLLEDLNDIAAHPINLNQTSAEELEMLVWLTHEQIDDILRYQYLNTFHSVYELQLLPSFRDYELRNLLPFVYVGEAKKEDHIYWREVFHYAKHELSLRTDVRNIEHFTSDPLYTKMRYRFNYSNRVQAGLTLCRPTGLPLDQLQYGGYIQLQDIGPIRNLSLGDFQANFGQGLVVGSPFHMGKSTYLSSGKNAKEGVRKFTSVGNEYLSFHGLGTTLRFGPTDVSAFYSLTPHSDSTWHHLLGVNATARWNRFKLGVTAIENLYDSVAEAVVGVNARYNCGKVDLWGEIAAAQANHWGMATIVGIDMFPIQSLHLLALYRYYSPHFSNPYAYAFSEKSKLNDETGFYLGAELRTLPNWRFAVYTDAFREGYDAMWQTDYQPAHRPYHMSWRLRARKQERKETYAFRYQFSYQLSSWNFRTQLDANMVRVDGYTYGASVMQDVEYQCPTIPLVLQWRIQAFDARHWNNRIYAYENDVLYAYSIPNVYGLGGRFWCNARYKINDMFSLYLRASHTLYQQAWAMQHNKPTTRSDIHLLLRMKW